MRLVRNTRELSSNEMLLASYVFEDSLPPWGRIFVTDGLGPVPGYDNPYTTEEIGLFTINVGPDMYPDVSLGKSDSFGVYRDTFIHEMTHVWQYYNGYWVILRSLWANSAGAGYTYQIDESSAWDDFNVEQQASIVEHWFARGRSRNDIRFVFVDKIVRAGVSAGFWANFEDQLLVKLPISQLRSM